MPARSPGCGWRYPGPERHIGFEDEAANRYTELLRQVLGGLGAPPAVWLYTPMALPLAEALVYDVMDALASFKGAPRELQLRQQQALRRADVVFTADVPPSGMDDRNRHARRNASWTASSASLGLRRIRHAVRYDGA
ncbi:MAG TPA: hypothetical protein VNA57_01700 [Acidimicrobiales bacterium]|nr:hypothetical protein [Acidimicrobiales bacterium]